MAPNISDLITDSKLEIEVFADHTIQTIFISNPVTGQRRTRERERWQRTRKLGEGTFGVVWLEKCTAGPSSGGLRAVKELRKGTTNGSPNYYQELEAIAKFSQERYRDHFVRSFGWYENNSAIFITMEYLQPGDLEGHLTTRLSHIEARQITHQLLEGLKFMHDNNFAHRDLKPSNILVLYGRPQWWVKIADFGITKRIDNTVLRTIIGTEAYLAPEVRGIFTPDVGGNDEITFSLAVDIWAVGAIAFRMVTGRLVFPPGRKLFDYVVGGQPFPIEESMSPECADFITKTMAASPRHRPTSQQALSYPWIVTQVPILNDSDLYSITSTNHDLDTIETIVPIASARWSTSNEESAILGLGNYIPSSNTINDSILSNTTTNEQQGRFQEVQRLMGHSQEVESVVFSPDGRLLVSSSFDRTVRIWEANGQGSLQQAQKFTGRVAAAFSVDGHRLALADRGIRILEADVQGRLQPVQKLNYYSITAHFLSVAFSPDGRRLVAGRSNGMIRIWEADRQGKFQEVQYLGGHSNMVTSLAFSPNGRWLASGSWDQTVWVWEADRQGRLQQIQRLEGHSAYVTSVAFSPDGRWLASGSQDQTIRIWEADGQRRLQQVQKFEGQGSPMYPDIIWSVAFSPNGRLLASASGNTVRIWEVGGQGKLQEIQRLEGHGNWVTSVAFAPDGRWLASSSYDGSIRIWKLDK